jgi:ribosomal protein S3AE
MAERKKYIEVQVPFLNESLRVLGTPQELHNKTIKLDLTRKLRGKGLTIKLRIFNQEGKLFAIPNSLTLASSYIRRMMRKRTNYVEDSFQARCSDIRVTFKPHLITRKKVSRVVRKNLRNTTKEFIIDYVKERDYITVCQEIFDGTLQKTLLPKLKKVYPLSFCDIRIFETKELEKIDIEKAIALPEIQIPEVQDIQEIPAEEETEAEEKKEEAEEKKEEVEEKEKEVEEKKK